MSLSTLLERWSRSAWWPDRSLRVRFVTFALVVLPIVLLLGLATFLRMGAANYHDAVSVLGMNWIRGAYLELAPDLDRFLVMSAHDDPPGIAVTMAVPPGSHRLLHVVSATPFVVNVLNGVVAGAIVASITGAIMALPGVVIVAASALAFVAVVAIQLRLVSSSMRRGRGSVRPIFPSPPAVDSSSSER